MKVDPKKLILTAIEAGTNGTIEQGYHLRWFIGQALELSDKFFPDEETVKKFVNYESPPDLVFGYEDGKKYTPPDAFNIYRRRHFFHLDHSVTLFSNEIRALLAGDIPFIRHNGVEFSVERKSERIEEHSSQTRSISERFLINVVSRILPFITRWIFRRWQPVILARFPKTIHCLLVESSAQSLWDSTNMQMECFADEDPEPIRREVFQWQGTSRWGEKESKIIIDQGHYDLLRFYSDGFLPLHIGFSFMEEDTTIAQDQENPARGEWVLINSIPFITSFENWGEARDYHFRHEVQNRYLDFDQTGSLNQREKLDLKYGGNIFKKMQQIFVSLKHAENLGVDFLSHTVEENLVDINLNPFFLFQLFSIDPIAATLFGLKYADVPGHHNPHKPKLETTYDYMVATTWQEEPNQHCYISQRVCRETTPRLLPPKDLVANQEEGLAWEGDTPLYRVGLNWKIAEKQRADYKRYEPVAFDIWRGDSGEFSSGSCITQYSDMNAEEEKNKVIDTPVIVSESNNKYPTTEEERSLYTPTQLLALDYERALLENDTSFVITTSHLLAHHQMRTMGRMHFLPPFEPSIKFHEWIPLTDTERTVFYAVRGIGVFGETSHYHAPIKATLYRRYPPPEAVRVSAYLVDGVNDSKDLVVSWRLGPYQHGLGARINHFNIVHKEIETKHKVRKFDIENYGDAWRRFGSTRPTGIPNEDTSEWRKFANGWGTGILNKKDPIPHKEPLSIKIVNVKSWEGSSITGKIIDCTTAASNIIIVEETEGVKTVRSSDYESALMGGTPITLKTDQCFFGIAPFVDIAHRYKQQVGPIDIELDELEIKIGDNPNDESYEVIGFEGGQSLRLTINFKGDCDKFLHSYGNKTFTLTFNKIKTELKWTQRISLDELPEKQELTEIKDKFVQIDADASLNDEQKKKKKQALLPRTLRIKILPGDIASEITGRESWFTNGAICEYQYPPSRGKTYRIPINDFVARFKEDKPAHEGPPNRRAFLDEITLVSMMLDAEQGSGAINPIPPFPLNMFEELLKGNSVELKFKVIIPPISQVFTNRSDEDSEELVRMERSFGGELSFVNERKELRVCEVLTRPCSVRGADRLSFLVKQMVVVPHQTSGQTVGMSFIGPPKEGSKFHHVYKHKIPDIHSKFPGSDMVSQVTNIAVSTHRNPRPQDIPEGYPQEDKDNLVSMPVEVQIPPVKPSVPVANNFPDIPADAFQDPFINHYTTLPKILDGKKVVQFEMKLTDSELMVENELTADGKVWEILRAPEDALRYIFLKKRRNNKPDFNSFNEMTQEEFRRTIITRLINDWNDSDYTLKGAFTPIAKLDGTTNQTLRYIDQIEGIGGASIYYAVREYRKGAPPGDMALLPFRANIVDTTPPPAPLVTKCIGGEMKTSIEWMDTSKNTICFKIYKADDITKTSDIRKMDPPLTYYTASDYGNPVVQKAPLRIERESRKLFVWNNNIEPFLVDDEILSIEGVYRKDDFDFSAFPLNSQQSSNFYDSNNGSQFDSVSNIISGLSIETNSDNPYVVVYKTKKTIVFRSPSLVVGNRIQLPQIYAIEGVYWALDYNQSLDPPGYNLYLATSNFLYQNIVDLDSFASSDLIVEYKKPDGEKEILENYSINSFGRIELPFGSRILGIKGVYQADLYDFTKDPSESQTIDNRFDADSTYDTTNLLLENILLPDDTEVVIVADFEIIKAVDSITYQTVELENKPQYQNITIQGIYPTDRVSHFINIIDFLPEDNYLGSKKYDTPLKICFLSTLAVGTPVTVTFHDQTTDHDQTPDATQKVSELTNFYYFEDDNIAEEGKVYYRLSKAISIKASDINGNEIEYKLDSLPSKYVETLVYDNSPPSPPVPSLKWIDLDSYTDANTSTTNFGIEISIEVPETLAYVKVERKEGGGEWNTVKISWLNVETGEKVENAEWIPVSSKSLSDDSIMIIYDKDVNRNTGYSYRIIVKNKKGQKNEVHNQNDLTPIN